MKPWLILGVLFVALVTMGSSCVNDSFIIPVNVPLEQVYETNPGGQWDDFADILIIGEIPESLSDDIVGSRLVDIEVQAIDPPPGASVQGTASVNGIPAVSFGGTGAQFANPVSLLNPGVPAVITTNQPGIDELLRVLDEFLLNPATTTVRISSAGAVSPAGSAQLIRVTITVQADAQGTN